MTHTPKSLKVTARRKFNALMIPYFAFFVLLAAYTILSAVALTGGTSEKFALLAQGLILGGRYLTGNFGVFWFVPVLTFVFILNDALERIKHLPVSPVSVIAISGLISAPMVSQLVGESYVPWLLNAVPIAFFYFWIGRVFQAKTYSTMAILGLAVAIVSISISAGSMGVTFTMNMKYGTFGPPLIGPMLAVALSVLTMQLCRLFPPQPLSWLGQRSLTVMFLHPPIMLLAGRFDIPWWASLPIALALPLLFHELAKRFGFTQRLFLGRRS